MKQNDKEKNTGIRNDQLNMLIKFAEIQRCFEDYVTNRDVGNSTENKEINKNFVEIYNKIQHNSIRYNKNNKKKLS